MDKDSNSVTENGESAEEKIHFQLSGDAARLIREITNEYPNFTHRRIVTEGIFLWNDTLRPSSEFYYCRQKNILQQIQTWLLNIVFFFALLLIFKGYIDFYYFREADLAGPIISLYEKYDKVTSWAGMILTILGTLFVSVSIYSRSFQSNRGRLPDSVSYFTAILAMLLCLLSVIWMFYFRIIVNDVVNGIAILGIFGGIARMRPWSDHPNLPNYISKLEER